MPISFRLLQLLSGPSGTCGHWQRGQAGEMIAGAASFNDCLINNFGRGVLLINSPQYGPCPASFIDSCGLPRLNLAALAPLSATSSSEHVIGSIWLDRLVYSSIWIHLKHRNGPPSYTRPSSQSFWNQSWHSWMLEGPPILGCNLTEANIIQHLSSCFVSKPLQS